MLPAKLCVKSLLEPIATGTAGLEISAPIMEIVTLKEFYYLQEE